MARGSRRSPHAGRQVGPRSRGVHGRNVDYSWPRHPSSESAPPAPCLRLLQWPLPPGRRQSVCTGRRFAPPGGTEARHHAPTSLRRGRRGRGAYTRHDTAGYLRIHQRSTERKTWRRRLLTARRAADSRRRSTPGGSNAQSWPGAEASAGYCWCFPVDGSAAYSGKQADDWGFSRRRRRGARIAPLDGADPPTRALSRWLDHCSSGSTTKIF